MFTKRLSALYLFIASFALFLYVFWQMLADDPFLAESPVLKWVIRSDALLWVAAGAFLLWFLSFLIRKILEGIDAFIITSLCVGNEKQ